MGIVLALMSEIPQLRAEERLDAIMDYSVGSGAAKRHDGQRHIRFLKRQIPTEKRTATVQELEKMGIVVNA